MTKRPAVGERLQSPLALEAVFVRARCRKSYRSAASSELVATTSRSLPEANAAGAGSSPAGSTIGSQQLAKCCSPEKAISAPNCTNAISEIVQFARLNILIYDERVIDLCRLICTSYLVA